jgi:hypothetical protein
LNTLGDVIPENFLNPIAEAIALARSFPLTSGQTAAIFRQPRLAKVYRWRHPGAFKDHQNDRRMVWL